MSFKLFVLAIATLALIQSSNGSPTLILEAAQKGAEDLGRVNSDAVKEMTSTIGDGLASYGLRGTAALWTGIGENVANIIEDFGKLGGSVASGYNTMGENILNNRENIITKGKEIIGEIMNHVNSMGSDLKTRTIIEEVSQLSNGFLQAANDDFERQLKTFESEQKKFEEKSAKIVKDSLKKLERVIDKQMKNNLQGQLAEAHSEAAKECLDEQKGKAEDEFDEQSANLAQCIEEKQNGESKEQIAEKIKDVARQFTEVTQQLRNECLQPEEGDEDPLECVKKISEAQKDALKEYSESVQERIKDLNKLTAELFECSTSSLDAIRIKYADINQEARECLKLRD